MQGTAGLLARNDTDCTYFQNDLRKKCFLAHFWIYREGFYVPCTAAVGVASGAKRCHGGRGAAALGIRGIWP